MAALQLSAWASALFHYVKLDNSFSGSSDWYSPSAVEPIGPAGVITAKEKKK
jgi:hypothetical protein